jgi:hypothetical protein
VQRNVNKRCMLFSLGYIVLLMRVIYYLSLVLYFYLGLYKRPLHCIIVFMSYIPLKATQKIS